MVIHSNKLLKIKTKGAFTLAEVLITLGIIGVVAAMTIPSLVIKYQKEQTLSGLKKAYSEVTRAVSLSVAENGSIKNWDWPTDSATYSMTVDFVEKYLLEYFSTMAVCGYLNSTPICQKTVKYLDGQTNYRYGLSYHIVLKDGSFVMFHFDTNPPSNITILVDLNGNKNPNSVGKDIFAMQLKKVNDKTIFPGHGLSRVDLLTNSSWGCNTDASWMAGWYCGALIQQDGWQIKDDYPWN